MRKIPKRIRCKICEQMFDNPLLKGSSIVLVTCDECRRAMYSPATLKKMEQDCYTGQITATDLADYLVEKNMPFRQAHEVVGKIVAHAEEKKLQIFELELVELKKFSKLINEDVKNYLDPAKTILSRKQTGGTAPSQVQREIRLARKSLAKRKL